MVNVYGGHDEDEGFILIEKNKMYTRYGKKREESLIDVVK
jgi:UPF0288 family protein (methanogenesis marker protein 3)